MVTKREAKDGRDIMFSAGQKILSVTVGVTELGTASVITVANFEFSMSQVQTTIEITKATMSTLNGRCRSINIMDTLSKLAKKIGAEVAFLHLNVRRH